MEIKTAHMFFIRDGFGYEKYRAPASAKTRGKADILQIPIVPASTFNGGVTAEIGICVGKKM